MLGLFVTSIPLSFLYIDLLCDIHGFYVKRYFVLQVNHKHPVRGNTRKLINSLTVEPTSLIVHPLASTSLFSAKDLYASV